MIPEQRARFNAQFTDAKYQALVHDANTLHKWPTDFRVSESPIFLSPEFTAEIAGAATHLVAQLRTPEFARHAADAIPAGLSVPAETPHPTFIQVDFAICDNGAGRLTPRLIELQGFPSRRSLRRSSAGLTSAGISTSCAARFWAIPRRKMSYCWRSSPTGKRPASTSPAPSRRLAFARCA
jgi:hypothetical protein